MDKIINNKAYYYIAAEREGITVIAYHLFLLFPVDQNTVIHCGRGVESQSSWSITAESKENTLNGSNQNHVLFNGQYFVKYHEKFAYQARKQEIVIHTYINEDSCSFYDERTVLLTKTGSLPNDFKIGDDIAYNCPYVLLEREKFVANASQQRLQFFPRVLLPKKRFDFQRLDDCIYFTDGRKEHLTTIIPLFKVSRNQEEMVKVDHLHINDEFYFDNDRIDGGFSTHVLLFETRKDVEAFKALSPSERSAFLADPNRERWGINILNTANRPLTNGPRSKAANSLSMSMLFAERI
ncbi:MAG: hypothetical protein AAF806_17940 [Bacteroidota bacterium]